MQIKAIIKNKHGNRKVIENPSDEYIQKRSQKTAKRARHKVESQSRRSAFLNWMKDHAVEIIAVIVAFIFGILSLRFA